MTASFILLGAGFSRAISPRMPLLPDLAQQVLEALDEPPAVLTSFDNNLEQWLSYLSVNQPWLSEAANLRNRAIFLEASRAVQQCIDRAEARVTYPEAWLERLVLDWCATQSTVATFNYDLLVERTTATLGRVSAWRDLYGAALDERQPPPRGLSYGHHLPPGPLYQLFKLHGSVNWGYGGLEAPPSERIVLTRTEQWWQAVDTDQEAKPDPALYDDLEPLIVPPTGTKGPYYGNRSLQGQWRRAFEALRTAPSVVIIGYSFPATDLVTRHFLSSAAPECPVTVVDGQQQAATTVQQLLPGATVTSVSGDVAVRGDFVDAACGDFVRWGTEHSPRGWRPRLIVNGTERALQPSSDAFDPTLSHEHPKSAMQWLDREVERQFPGLAGHPRTHLRRPDAGNVGWQGSHAPRSNIDDAR